jgi:DNA-directed RNA polymerase I subunit RPA1
MATLNPQTSSITSNTATITLKKTPQQAVHASTTTSNNPDACIITKQVHSVEFGLYSDADVRTRSVVEITSPQTYLPAPSGGGSGSGKDAAVPLPHGLYDPRLGPVSSQEKTPCPTCCHRFQHCPGHFGHVELCVPLYQPLLFMSLMDVLRMKCFHCHKLRASRRSVDIAHAKLLLLVHHRLVEYQEFDTKIAVAIQEHDAGAATTSSGGASKAARAQQAGHAMDTLVQGIIQDLQYKPLPSTTSATQCNMLKEFRKALLKEFKAIPKCFACGAFSPKLKHDQYNKIFQAALSETAQRMNASDNIQFQSALQTLQEKNEKKTAKKKEQASEEEENEGYDSEDTDVREDGIERGVEEEAMEVDEEDDDEGNDKDEDEAMDEKELEQKIADSSAKAPDRDQFYMHPGEVQAQCELLWKKHGKVLSLLVFGRRDGVSYQHFFVQAVAIPPSRFRPPMHTAGMVVEHAQNQYLTKLITENAAVRDALFQTTDDSTDSSPTQTKETEKDAVTKPKDPRENERRAHTLWIQLQTTLNCFMDNTKDPSTAAALGQVPPGIRQLMEKKEGIFRKHMMGKRVDYACRSVISPDPYIGTNEIGIPLAFAKVLTYPTPVTEWNATEMRRLVERGPHQYPGARWVQLGTKRMDLGHMKAEQRHAVAALLLNKDTASAETTTASATTATSTTDVSKYSKVATMPAIVGRQLRHGDTMLVNRQVRTIHSMKDDDLAVFTVVADGALGPRKRYYLSCTTPRIHDGL